MTNSFRINDYLARIQYTGAGSIDAETLTDLHLAQMRSIPYENLSIIAGQPIRLDEAALYEKLIMRRRGGFCYEINILFARLLRELGFSVQIISARIAKPDTAYGFGPNFDHIALLVTLPLAERWLVDVGNSRWFDAPLRLDSTAQQVRNYVSYRINRLSDVFMLYQSDTDQGERLQYLFTLEERRSEDFAQLCQYKAKSPNSNFTRGRMCSRATEEGRITLSERITYPDGTRLRELKLIAIGRGERTERPLISETEFDTLLQDYFGIPVAAV